MGTWGQWEWAPGQSGNLRMKGMWGTGNSQAHSGIIGIDKTWVLGMVLGTLQGPEDRGDMLRGHPG